MKVCVKLYGTLVRHISESIRSRYPDGLRAGQELELQLSEASTLKDLLERLELRRKDVVAIFVDGRARDDAYTLSNEDRVGIFPPVGGG